MNHSLPPELLPQDKRMTSSWSIADRWGRKPCRSSGSLPPAAAVT